MSNNNSQIEQFWYDEMGWYSCFKAGKNYYELMAVPPSDDHNTECWFELVGKPGKASPLSKTRISDDGMKARFEYTMDTLKLTLYTDIYNNQPGSLKLRMIDGKEYTRLCREFCKVEVELNKE